MEEPTERFHSGWEPVVPNTQPTLFPIPLDEALSELQITRAQVGTWWARGWLSFADTPIIDQPAWNELVIVRDMEQSGLGYPTIHFLLDRLPRPLAIDPTRLAYSFSAGWVMRPLPKAPEVEDLDESLVEAWIDSRADEDIDILWRVLDTLTKRLRRT